MVPGVGFVTSRWDREHDHPFRRLEPSRAEQAGTWSFQHFRTGGVENGFLGREPPECPRDRRRFEGERGYLGVRQVAELVASLREEYGSAIYLDADHTHSLTGVEEAAKAGFDLIVFDGSELPFAQNVAQTKQAVEIAKAIHPSILVEGELGFIGSGSQVHGERPASAAVQTSPEEAKQFVDATRVDILSPAVGTMHGMLSTVVTGKIQKHIDAGLVAEIRRATGKFLTLHGGSGTSDEDFRQAIRAGISIVHINTELRLAWRRGIEEGLTEHPDEVVPYKLLKAAQPPVEKVVESRLRLFSGQAA